MLLVRRFTLVADWVLSGTICGNETKPAKVELPDEWQRTQEVGGYSEPFHAKLFTGPVLAMARVFSMA